MKDSRLDRVRKAAAEVGAVGALIHNPIDLGYLTGLNLSAGLLFVGKEARLYVDGRYLEACSSAAPMPVSPLKDEVFGELPKGAIAFDSETTPYQTYQKWAAKLKLTPVPSLMKRVRSVKEPIEIERLRAAAALCGKGYDYLLTRLREGVEERELAREFELFCLGEGGEALSFEPIIAFGEHGAYPHYRSARTPLKEGDAVLLDLGFRVDRYQSDMTRVVGFGPLKPEIKKIYRIVREAMEAALAILKPGVTASKLDRAAREVITEAGYGEAFCHSLGHGVGLEVHEHPVLRDSEPYSKVAMEAGMVITIEPGIYLPGVGGVRLEDTVVVTGKGYESLTNRPFTP
ncbi:MAG: M24 family metallopeptidase [Parachlamydiales bacterium]